MKTKNLTIPILVLVIASLLGVIIYSRGGMNILSGNTPNEEGSNQVSDNTETPTNDQQAKEEPEESIVAAITKLFTEKYPKYANSTRVTISEREGDFVIGGVRFTDELVGGGYFLAAKIDGVWKLLYDGNGTIPCSSIDPVKFPSSLQSECWNTVTNELDDRTKNQEFSPQK